MPIYIIYYIIVYKVIWYYNRALDLSLFASGTIFNGGPRTETKFRKWALSLKRLRTAALDTDITVLLALEHDNIYMDSIHLYMDSTHLHLVVYQCLYYLRRN